jgi:hypothetical protein
MQSPVSDSKPLPGDLRAMEYLEQNLFIFERRTKHPDDSLKAQDGCGTL